VLELLDITLHRLEVCFGRVMKDVYVHLNTRNWNKIPHALQKGVIKNWKEEKLRNL